VCPRSACARTSARDSGKIRPARCFSKTVSPISSNTDSLIPRYAAVDAESMPEKPVRPRV
jgi:hypothetical protein